MMTEIGSQEVETWEEDTQKDKFLTFIVENECYGIEIKYVTEIIGIQKITEIPEMPDFIRGIINLRGKIILVMDIRLRFKKPFQPYNDRTCIVVIDVDDLSIGLIVDSVSEVLSIPDSEIVAPPEIHQKGNKYVMGVGTVGEDVKLILDCTKLLNTDEAQTLETIGKEH
ncbi:chemotaxis protein CheW [Neobacillus sp. OS1-32]|jgi:purine-binding chemotaxis protein CheW|uniref:chemotaxis protein CheW n=1 Tax=Neobacillus sp. OS1-32 TaxID=3070682 RepID=UPI0027E16BF8|nr:chemotaxis protein CheW [Neobacillus sp. OS1-32]WML32303.1 chemotaxis protein CheW [Neobacillus sp. OS1-32]